MNSKVKLVLAGIANLEKHMQTQDESIKALKAAFDAFKASVSGSLDNIVADETAILAQLKTLGSLTPENQAIVDSVVADMGALATKTRGIADSIPDVPAPPAV